MVTPWIPISKGQLSCDAAGERLILRTRDGVYFGLDPVGARVWSLLAEPCTVARIRDALLSEFDVESRRCEEDLLALLSELASHELLEVVGGGDG